MKITHSADPTDQMGSIVVQLSELYEQCDAEISQAITEIEEKYAPQIEELCQLMESIRALVQ